MRNNNNNHIAVRVKAKSSRSAIFFPLKISESVGNAKCGRDLAADCAASRNLESAVLVRERLNLRHPGVRTIHETAPAARVQCDVRENHISGVGETEAVEGFDQVAIYVVNMNAAAAGCGAGVRLRDEEELVHRIEFDIRAAEELILGAGERLRKPGLRRQVVKLHAEVDFSGGAYGTGGWINREAIDVAKPNPLEFAEGASCEIDCGDESRHNGFPSMACPSTAWLVWLS